LRPRSHELHNLGSIGRLRAGVLGANDGILSVSSLIVGVAAAHSAHANILLSAVSGLVAGAMSMATGEYVSVHSQADTENAALDQEKAELEGDYAGESRELTEIYQSRGLDGALAKQVADQLMAHDALGAHAREELGLSTTLRARPIQAALTSAASFACGAFIPLAVAAFAPPFAVIPATVIASLLCLLTLGALAARVGGASMSRGALRVAFWSALAMAVSAAVGTLFGAFA